ncbi:MAG: LptF/LptG family permease [Pseudomonadota bacterium]
MVRRYAITFLGFCLSLLAVVYLFDVVELMRRASKGDGVPLVLLFEMAILKLPDVGQQISPFAILFSAMLLFWGLNRHHEFTILRAAGYSIWQILGPVLLLVSVIGVIMSTLINPIGAMLLTRYQVLENVHLKQQQSMVTLSKQGLWLRQPVEGGYALLYAQSLNTKTWKLDGVMTVYFRKDDTYYQRVDAGMATLRQGAWVFDNAMVSKPGNLPQMQPSFVLPTDLTHEDLIESFAAPSAMSFWSLPKYIETLEATGFDTSSMRMYLHTLFAQPVFYMAMILLAATVSFRPHRLQQGLFAAILAGALSGLGIFFFSTFLQALGGAHQIPLLLAAWAPSLIVVLLTVGILLAQEDG